MVLELQKPRPVWQIMFSTHHTDVAYLYTVTSLAFLFMAGVLAMVIRTHLFLPGAGILISDSVTFISIFTVHGSTMLFLFALPFAVRIAKLSCTIIVVLQRLGVYNIK